MSRILHALSMVVLTATLTTTLTATMALAQPQHYVLETDNSSVEFTYRFNATPAKGTMPVTKADLRLDFETLANSRVTISLNAAKARTGFILATEALRSKSVLFTQRYPQITFVSTRVRATATGAQIDGNVTLRGVTKPMTISARFARQKGHADGDMSHLVILLIGSISRSQFGATGYDDLVGDVIDLRIRASIRLQAP